MKTGATADDRGAATMEGTEAGRNAEPRQVTLTTATGAFVTMATIPANPGDGYTVAAETSRLVQKAYERGMRDQQEILERAIQDAVKAAGAPRKGTRPR